MRFVEIAALENGAHRNQSGGMTSPPNGWAVIPDDMETPCFPFGEVEAAEIGGVMTVTKWTAGTIPETPAVEAEPTTDEILNAMLGVNE